MQYKANSFDGVEMIMNIIIYILSFLYVFDFEVVQGVIISKSSIISGAFLLIYSLINFKYLKEIKKYLLGKSNITIIAVALLVIIWGMLITFINDTSDYSFIGLLLHLIINLEIGIMLAALLKVYNINIMNVVINIFFIQSLIQILSFISPSFMTATDIFRGDNTILLRDSQYAGFRGLAIAGSGFFGLGATYGIVFLLLGFYWNNWNKKLYLKTLYVACLIFGAITAARISLLGILLFFLIVIKKEFTNIRDFKLNIIKAVFSLLPMLVIISFIFVLWGDKIENALYQSKYIAQIFQIINQGSGVSLNSVGSLDALFNRMYFTLDFSQFFLGDGLYTNWDGSYYMSTDAGYMRNILYFGIWGEILLMLLQYVILEKSIGKYFGQKVLWIVMSILMIFEIKGQIIGLLIMVESVFMLFIAARGNVNRREND